MRAKKSKTGLGRGLAILLSLAMLTGMPMRAFAAELDDAIEINASDADVQEFDFEDDEDFDIVSEDFDDLDELDEEYDLEDDVEVTPEIIEDMLEASESEDTASVVDGAEEEALDIDIQEEDALEKALEILRSNGLGIPENNGDVIVPETDYSLTRYPDRLHIENKTKASAKPKADYLYAALTYKDEAKQGNVYVFGTPIAAGKSVDITAVYGVEGKKDLIDDSSEYVLWLGRGDTYIDEETGEVEYYGFKILGSIPKLDEEGVTHYIDAEMDKVPVPVPEKFPEYTGEWKDGYDGIKMKAVIQKNLSSVKISWTPDTKDAEQKTFKKFKIYQLEADANEATGYKKTQLPTSGKDPYKLLTAKTYTQKNVNIKESSLLYLLECYDKDEVLKAQYVTSAAPYLLEIQSGATTGNFDFVMTKRPDTAQRYQLEIATKNKERYINEVDKNPTGFQDDWSTVYEIEEGFNDELSIGEYYVSKKVHQEAIQLAYNVEKPDVFVGSLYYGRIRTVTYIDGMKVTSAPSNVLSCKAGPQKCHMLTSAGVYYDTKNAKNGNAFNIKRASDHINAYFNGDEISSQSNMYVHGANTNVCFKSGLIYFVVDKENIEGIKAFDLLKCTYENGKYTKLKRYSITNPALMECTVNLEYLKDYKIYAMYYNNFTPEKDVYYAVRAVSKTKTTPGGRGMGEKISSDMDVVQGLITQNVGADRIELFWLADDCVKQYWVYRSERPIDPDNRTSARANGETRIAKISANKAKKGTVTLSGETDKKTIKYIKYTDKKGIQAEKPYYYYVRPIYKTAEAAADDSKYMDRCSDEVRGKASALYARVTNFKAANNGVESVKLSFNQVKNITRYRIFRLEVNSSTKKLKDSMKPDLKALYEEAYKQEYQTMEEFEDYLGQQPESRWKEIITSAGADGNKWEYIDSIQTEGSATNTKSWTDKNAEVGSYYFYLVQPANDVSSSVIFSYTDRVRNVPLPVTNASASYDGASNGIRLKWELDSRDKNKSHLNVQVSTDGGNSWNGANKTGYLDTSFRRGAERNYRIRVRYYGGVKDVYSSEVTLKYSLPSGIEVTNAGDYGSFNNDNLTINVDETGKLAYRAYLSDGSTAPYNKIERVVVSQDSNAIEITESGSNYFVFKAKQPGYVTFELSCAGIVRRVTVTVKKK